MVELGMDKFYHISLLYHKYHYIIFYIILLYGYGSIPINTILRGMNIHLPAILMWTTGVQGFDTLPYHYSQPTTTHDQQQAAMPVNLSKSPKRAPV